MLISQKKLLKQDWWRIKKAFNNNFKLFDNDINVFVLLLRKGVCLYEFMDKWETLNETSLSKRKIFILT